MENWLHGDEIDAMYLCLIDNRNILFLGRQTVEHSFNQQNVDGYDTYSNEAQKNVSIEMNLCDLVCNQNE